MKVLLIGPYPRDGQYSIPAFVSTLASGLKDLGVEVTTSNPHETKIGKLIRPIVGKRTSFIDKFLLYPLQLRKLARNFDLVHIAEHGYSPYVGKVGNKPTLVTCHDLIVAKAARGELADWPLSGPAKKYQEAILRGLAHANQVVAVSETTRQDVLRLTNRSHGRTSLIFNGFYRNFASMDANSANEILSNKNACPEIPFLFHIGGDQPNKNKIGIARIFGEIQKSQPSIKLDLVFAGTPPNEALQREIADLPDPSRVHLVVRPSDEEVAALYSLAKALIFPSLYEGFGLPIIEAQACGTPVITSNRPPMTEVGADSAIYVDPEDASAAAETIVKALPLIHDFVPMGYENIKRFDTKTMCQGYFDLYTQMVSH